MIQTFHMDRCHRGPFPEYARVFCRSIQRKVKDFFSFFTCSMSAIRKPPGTLHQLSQSEDQNGSESAEPCAVKAACTVLNGGDTAPCRYPTLRVCLGHCPSALGSSGFGAWVWRYWCRCGALSPARVRPHAAAGNGPGLAMTRCSKST